MPTTRMAVPTEPTKRRADNQDLTVHLAAVSQRRGWLLLVHWIPRRRTRFGVVGQTEAVHEGRHDGNRYVRLGIKVAPTYERAYVAPSHGVGRRRLRPF